MPDQLFTHLCDTVRDVILVRYSVNDGCSRGHEDGFPAFRDEGNGRLEEQEVAQHLKMSFSCVSNFRDLFRLRKGVTTDSGLDILEWFSYRIRRYVTTHVDSPVFLEVDRIDGIDPRSRDGFLHDSRIGDHQL